MLRALVVVVGLAALAGGVAALYFGSVPSALVFGGWGVLLVAGTFYERFRYKPLEAAPLGRNWSPTGERFIDDETGKPVIVYVENRTGERKYVAR